MNLLTGIACCHVPLSRLHTPAVSCPISFCLIKVSEDDVSSYQWYTIRKLNQKEPNIPDTDQYKLSSVKEDALSNTLKHLDVMSFPTLFPSGRFGEGYERDVKLTSSKYVKSCLLHKDSSFYLLWQKEMGQLAAGVCNLLKGTWQHSMPSSGSRGGAQGVRAPPFCGTRACSSHCRVYYKADVVDHQLLFTCGKVYVPPPLINPGSAPDASH